jgi:hypothetical protein
MELVTGFEEVEPLRTRLGGCLLDFGARRGFEPPSWVFVGTEEVVDVEGEGGTMVVDTSESSTPFRFRFRTILLETVAACNSAIVGHIGNSYIARLGSFHITSLMTSSLNSRQPRRVIT